MTPLWGHLCDPIRAVTRMRGGHVLAASVSARTPAECRFGKEGGLAPFVIVWTLPSFCAGKDCMRLRFCSFRFGEECRKKPTLVLPYQGLSRKRRLFWGVRVFSTARPTPELENASRGTSPKSTVEFLLKTHRIRKCWQALRLSSFYAWEPTLLEKSA